MSQSNLWPCPRGFAQAPMKTLGASTSEARDVASSHPFFLLSRVAETLRWSQHQASGSYAILAPVVEYIVPAPAASHVALAPIVESCAPEVAYSSLAPVVEYIAPAASFLRYLRPWMSTSRLRLLWTLHLHVSLSTSRLRQLGTQHQHIGAHRASPAVSFVAPAPVDEYKAPAPAITASKGCTFCRATGRCKNGLSPEFHREGAHLVFGRLVRLPHARRVAPLRLACTTSSR